MSLESEFAAVKDMVTQCRAAVDALQTQIAPLQEQLAAMQAQATTLAGQLELIRQRQQKYKVT